MEPYGTVSFSRLSGDFDLVGSRIKTNGAVALRISTGSLSSEYGEDKILEEKKLIEVYLSPNQFSELLTTMNVGNGVPCTIKRIQGRDDIKPYQREINTREHSEILLKRILSELDEKCADLIKKAGDLKGQKSSRESILFDLEVLRSHFASNIPFVNDVFQEQMDKVVTEAKADVDALVTHTVTQLGIKSLKNRQYLIEE